jgi:hypothetical protein
LGDTKWRTSKLGRFEMRDLNELNINEGGKPVTRPRPTPDQISFVEDLVGTKLPPSYIAFLMFSNGGHPELDTFRFEAQGFLQEWGVDVFFYISSDIDSTENIVWNYEHRWSDAPKGILPIADDGGGNLICLDLTEPGSGKVVLWIHDVPDQTLLPIADSFEEFIDLLVENPDYI